MQTKIAQGKVIFVNDRKKKTCYFKEIGYIQKH